MCVYLSPIPNSVQFCSEHTILVFFLFPWEIKSNDWEWSLNELAEHSSNALTF